MNSTFQDRLAAPRLSIIAEGADWLVVDKPAGLLVHPSKPGGPVTLWHGLRELLAFELANGGQVSIINRLDRETSGVTLIAKNVDAARRFTALMEARAIHKEYVAIVHGWPDWEETMLDAPMARKGEFEPSPIWLKQCIHPAGAAARTRFVVERRFLAKPHDNAKLSVLRAFPETGRMHQIRVHAAHLGFPLVGDKIYGADESHYLRFIETGWTPELAAALWLPRHALHASVMALETEKLRWSAPLAPDLAEFLRECEAETLR